MAKHLYYAISIGGFIFVVLFILNLLSTYEDMIQEMENTGKLRQPKQAHDGQVVMSLSEDILTKKFENHKITKEEMGRHGWRVLHLFSLNLPDKLDEAENQKIQMFIKLLYYIFFPLLVYTYFFQKRRVLSM